MALSPLSVLARRAIMVGCSPCYRLVKNEGYPPEVLGLTYSLDERTTVAGARELHDYTSFLYLNRTGRKIEAHALC
jgi:hypothetical protein